MKRVMIYAVIMSIAVIGVSAQTPDTLRAKLKVTDKVPAKARPFDLNQVKLLNSPFKHAMELDGKYLLELELDRLLSRFREFAGLKPKAEIYGNAGSWEGGNLSGQTAGHYLTACSMMYRSTGDKRYLDRVNYMIDELAEVQKANGNGFVGAMPNGKKLFAEMSAAKTNEQMDKAYSDNEGGVPWYNMHKTFAGLRDAYLLCGNEKAKDILIKLADWVCDWQKDIPEEVFQHMLDIEHGGINESLADAYAISGNPKHLEAAKRFYHHRMLDPLKAHEDKLGGNHANTQIPKFIGAARIYELTKLSDFRTIASFSWDTILKNHTYVIGGNSCYEYFGDPGKLNDRITPNTTETCNTYNMLKLTEHLFQWTADAKYADYYERGLYNHILASQSPSTGMMCYYVALKSGHVKKFSTPFDSFWCCVGTGIENHVKYGQGIYYHDDKSLYINLFIPSELNWSEKGFKLKQETDLPMTDIVRFTVTCTKPTVLKLMVRQPAWAFDGITAKVNGKPFASANKPSSYLALSKTWKTGDKIEVKLPMRLYTEYVLDNKERMAVLYGPIVLAGRVEQADPDKPMTVLVTEGRPAKDWVKRVPGKLEFVTSGVGKPSDITLVPFYAIDSEPYAIYWDTFKASDWAKKQVEFVEKQRQQEALEARTVDNFSPGEMQ
ncbi:MAG: glycoside hydrolase family 127 protein [Armatimonadetes bacterium]|nr:glycoside hydrolase family 127 protein [Armatimonadota bacterium]